MGRTSSRQYKKVYREDMPITGLEQVLIVMLCVLLVALPMMLGTAIIRFWPLFLAKIALCIIFVLHIFLKRDEREKQSVPLFFFVLLLMVFVAIIQLLPLPPFILNLISPNHAAIFSSPFSAKSGLWMSISLNQAETWRGISWLIPLLLIFLIGSDRFSDGQRKRILLILLGLTGLLIASIGFTHKIFNAHKIFGIIDFPKYGRGGFIFSTFINPNNFAAFLGMCVPIQIATAFSVRDKNIKYLLVLSAIITSSALMLSLSKSGIISFFIGQTVLVLLVLIRKKKHAANKKNVALIFVFVSIVFAIAAFLASDHITNEFKPTSNIEDQTSDIKYAVWKDSAMLIKDFPLTGIGLKTFEIVYPKYKQNFSDSKFVFPENIVLQLFSDFGILFGGFLLAAFMAVLFLAIRKRNMKYSEIGIISSLIVVSIQNLADHSLNTYAIAIPFAFLLGILCSRTSLSYPKLMFSHKYLGNIFRISFALFAIIVIFWGEYQFGTNGISAAQSRVYDAAFDKSISDSKFMSVFKHEFREHRTDFYLHLIASERYRITSKVFLKQLAHLEEAKRLNPSDPQTYLMFAKAYKKNNQKGRALAYYQQALLKVKTTPEMFGIFDKMIRMGFSAEDLADSTPRQKLYVLELSHFLFIRHEYWPARMLLLDWTGTNEIRSPKAYKILGDASLYENDILWANKMAGKLIKYYPDNFSGYYLQADIQKKKGDLNKAIEYYLQAEKLNPGNITLLLKLTSALIDKKQIEQAEFYALKIHGMVIKQARYKADILIVEARIYESKKRYRFANKEYKRVLQLRPNNGYVLYRIAKNLHKLEDIQSAISYTKKAIASGYDKPAVKDFLKHLKALQ